MSGRSQEKGLGGTDQVENRLKVGRLGQAVGCRDSSKLIGTVAHRQGIRSAALLRHIRRDRARRVVGEQQIEISGAAVGHRNLQDGRLLDLQTIDQRIAGKAARHRTGDRVLRQERLAELLQHVEHAEERRESAAADLIAFHQERLGAGNRIGVVGNVSGGELGSKNEGARSGVSARGERPAERLIRIDRARQIGVHLARADAARHASDGWRRGRKFPNQRNGPCARGDGGGKARARECEISGVGVACRVADHAGVDGLKFETPRPARAGGIEFDQPAVAAASRINREGIGRSQRKRRRGGRKRYRPAAVGAGSIGSHNAGVGHGGTGQRVVGCFTPGD